MSKFSQEIEVNGHLIDSSILTKIFDKIMDLHGEFQVEEINIGKRKKDQSYVRLLVNGKNQEHLDEILKTYSRIMAEIKLTATRPAMAEKSQNGATMISVVLFMKAKNLHMVIRKGFLSLIRALS